MFFAFAATVQQDVVVATVDHDGGAGRTLGPRRLLAIVRSRRWLGGAGLTGVGSALHVVALALAPVVIVQPVGVLAVPIGVVLTARRTHRRPPGHVVAAVALTVAGVAAFVVVAALGQHSTDTVEVVHIGRTTAVLVLVALLLGFAGSHGPRWVRCATGAAAGAVLCGLASALIRTVMLLIGTGRGFEASLLTTVVGIVVCFAVGGWFIQQAFATGAAEVVLACLTVLDPIVAVLFGLAFLGEGDQFGPTASALMAGSGALAALGVVLLARHHPDAHTSPSAAEADDTAKGIPS